MNRTQMFSLNTRLANEIRISGIAVTAAILMWVAGAIGSLLLAFRAADWVVIAYVLVTVLSGIYVLFALKVANQWEKAVVLRFGKFGGLRGPGIFWVIPIVENIAQWIDHRVIVSPFRAEKTLTKDTVPVDVDAVLFWLVWDAEKAALEVEDYRSAIS